MTNRLDGWPPAALLFSLSVETLDDRIARDGPIKELDAVGWAIRLAKRLEALHSLGVAHGSISPACILTAGADRTSRAFIADVQVTTSSLAFQSPERVLGGDLSPADDAWAVACTLYTALTGTSPFAGAHDAETKQKILSGQPAPLAVFDVGDDDLQRILDEGLTREFGQRTSSVTALRNALEEWHPDPGVGALPPLDDDDDDASEGDEDMHTVMRTAPVFAIPAFAPPVFAAPPVRKPAVAPPDDDDDDDDDEDQATRMREFQIPPGLMGGSPFGGPAPSPFSPGPAADRDPGPRPAAGRPQDAPPSGFSAPAALGGPAAPGLHAPFGAPGFRPGAPPAHHGGPSGAMAFGGGSGPMGAAAPSPVLDDDDDDENGRTMMRNSPVDDTPHPSGLRVAQAPAPDEDDEDEGARTVMRDVGAEPWGGAGAHPAPAPAAPFQFGGPPPGPAPAWNRDPAPAKTLALSGFEFPGDSNSSSGPSTAAFPASPDGAPPGFGGPPGVGFGLPPGVGFGGPLGGPGGFAPMAMAPPSAAPFVAPYQAGPQPGPMAPMAPMGFPGAAPGQLEAAAAAANSRRIVVLTAAIALLVIAATTFVVLLLRGLK